MRSITITIDSLVHSKVLHWVRLADKFEVSGFGKVIRQPYGLHVVDAVLLKQENTSFSTEIDAASMGRAMFETKDLPGELSWWWHSHGRGSTFWSHTDHEQIENFGKHGWIAATVFNIFGDSKSAFYANEPFPHFVDDLDFRPIHIPPQELTAGWETEYDGKVRNFEMHQNRRGKRRFYEVDRNGKPLASGKNNSLLSDGGGGTIRMVDESLGEWSDLEMDRVFN